MKHTFTRWRKVPTSARSATETINCRELAALRRVAKAAKRFRDAEGSDAAAMAAQALSAALNSLDKEAKP